jgi:hypothetical protein
MDIVPDLPVQCIKDRDGGPGTVSSAILVIATGKLEFEIE